MKIKTKDLIGATLDWAVAKCEGYIDDWNSWLHEATVKDVAESGSYHPSADWSIGGPLLETYRVRLDCPWDPGPWEATCRIDGRTGWVKGPTALIAAMRCIVLASSGDEVEIPEELA